jgi:hypothetical protein
MHAAFSRFIRPGSQIIYSSDTNSVAALVPSTGNLVIVLRNNANSNIPYTIDLSRCTTLGTSAEFYRFSLPGKLSRLDDIPINEKKLSFNAPAQTITTCVIPGSTTAVKKERYKIPEARSFSLSYTNNTLRFHTTPGTHLKISIFNSTGKLLLSSQYNAGGFSEKIDLNRYMPDGMYLVKIEQNRMVTFYRILISK